MFEVRGEWGSMGRCEICGGSVWKCVWGVERGARNVLG